MNKLDLTALLERVRNAAGPDRELDCRLSHHFDQKGIWYGTGDDSRWAPVATVDGWDEPKWASMKDEYVSPLMKHYTASIDAAVALVERVLPEWQYHMGTCGEDDMPWACITEPVDPCRDFAASAPEITLALLTSLLLALTSNQEVQR